MDFFYRKLQNLHKHAMQNSFIYFPFSKYKKLKYVSYKAWAIVIETLIHLKNIFLETRSSQDVIANCAASSQLIQMDIEQKKI